jgi:TolB-like protein/Tfp pilus assembly protein PilF
MPTPSLLQRLKERKLVQWALAYLAGAWVIYEVVDTVGDRWSLPDVFFRGFAVLLAIGFLVALVIAWYHGEKGRQRVSGPELLMVAALLVIAGGVLSMLGRGEEAREPTEVASVAGGEDDRPGVAVLPCENFSPNPEDAFFASGIHEEILVKLQKISGLRSIGRESVEWYRDNPRPMREMALDLGVGFVGECSVRKDVDQNEIRVTFQLIDATTGSPLWAENYDESLSAGRIFDIHSDVAEQVAHAIGAVLTPEEQALLSAGPTESLEAYNAYLVGRHWWNHRTGESTQEAIRQFEEAIRLDSTFALAYVGLADSYMIAPWYGGEEFISVEEAHSRGLAAAQRALKIDDELGEAHASLGAIKLFFEWKWEEAEREFQTAIELSPRYVMAHQWYGLFLDFVGKPEKALERFQLALDLDPLYPTIHRNFAVALQFLGRYEEAIEHLERSLELFPDHAAGAVALGVAYQDVGRYAEAIALGPGEGYATLCYMALGREDEARALAERIDQEGSLRQRLWARTGIGDVDGAFAVLEEALDRRLPWLVQTPNVSPFFEPLRSDPRWADYLRRIGLDQYR